MPITLDGTNGITQADQFNSDSTFGFKNRIINGAMVIDQRNAGASVTITTAEEFITDRWQFAPSASSKLTAQQSSTAPAGFNNSLLLTSSAATSVASGDYYFLQHKIEGFNFADCNWGTADAKTTTLSFWCRSSVTGTYGGALVNSAQNRSYPFTYSISSANTWEYKTVTVAGDTTGTWIGATNGTGVRLRLGFGVGSTYSGTAGSWAGSNFMSATSATNWISTNGATFYITGVQLEVGSTATSFDYRPYGTELQLCQRYFQTYGYESDEVQLAVGLFYTNTEATAFRYFGVNMRAKPTYSSTTVTNGYRYTRANANTLLNTLPYYGTSGTAGATFGDINLSVAGTAGQATLISAIAPGAKINFSAEL